MSSSQIDHAETAEHMSDAVTYLQRVALRAGFEGIAAELAIIAYRLKSMAIDENPASTENLGRKH
ncbi:hypothetical protein [Bradyrhizobium sp. th.b2]|uniref:hypothetical protein n=1 Tax=Bradyrhizobium sp. th-b2 TaxID=172088 RepID=UPI00048CBFB1|nr:hypothetical protein [Bradyrhizobium sp. th.b2]